MKSTSDVIADIERRLVRSWATDAVARAGGPAGEVTWPHPFSLSLPKSSVLEAKFGEVTKWNTGWRAWAADFGVPLRTEPRRIAGTDQTLCTHVTVPDIDKAASLVGGVWPERLARSRKRASVLLELFPNQPRPAWMLNASDNFSNIDFGLLLDVADWFSHSTADERAQRTPRQVPVEGIHAKWLNTRRALVAELAGLEDLGLLPPHPARIHFTYLDPDHLDVGGRRHDSASVGDSVELPYTPRLVLISENKDTAVGFPRVSGGLAIEGAGRGASTHAAFPWIYDVPVVVYWGDMDADGLEILNEFRGAGLVTHSLFMDRTAFEEWERFGTNTDPQGKTLGVRPARPVEHLTEPEAELYACLLSADWERFRRVEQERIPLAVAHAALLELVEAGSAGPTTAFDPHAPGSPDLERKLEAAVAAPVPPGYLPGPRATDDQGRE